MIKIYSVGGRVRDALMGRTRGKRNGSLRDEQATDRDWVVVGATPDELLKRGFVPVGKDFPVFLHPQTHEEYALARTERKTAPGYKGFVFHTSPEVTLEEDLARRDLTINAMAMGEEGVLVDPFGGARDIEAGILRHVSTAFAEDPVRILRVARFAARFPDFTLAPETAELLREMVANGEADALVPERVMQELSRGLMEVRPSRMIDVLVDCGLLERLYSELEDTRTMSEALDRAAARGLLLPSRFAVFTSACRSTRAVVDLLGKLRATNESAQLAKLLCDLAEPMRTARDAADILAILERADAFRRPERFEMLIGAYETIEQTSADDLRLALRAARQVDAGALAAGHQSDPQEIARRIRQARAAAVAEALQD